MYLWLDEIEIIHNDCKRYKDLVMLNIKLIILKSYEIGVDLKNCSFF